MLENGNVLTSVGELTVLSRIPASMLFVVVVVLIVVLMQGFGNDAFVVVGDAMLERDLNIAGIIVVEIRKLGLMPS